MATYGKKAGEKVEKALHEKKEGTLEERPLGQEGHEQEAGDRDRALGSSRGGRQGPGQERRSEEERGQEDGPERSA